MRLVLVGVVYFCLVGLNAYGVRLGVIPSWEAAFVETAVLIGGCLWATSKRQVNAK